MVALSHPYMTTGNTIALTRWNFVSKVMSLLSDMASGFVTAFMTSPSPMVQCGLVSDTESHQIGAVRNGMEKIPALPSLHKR